VLEVVLRAIERETNLFQKLCKSYFTQLKLLKAANGKQLKKVLGVL